MRVIGAIRGNGSATDLRVEAVTGLFDGQTAPRSDHRDCDLLIQAGFQQSPALKRQMALKKPFLILENPTFRTVSPETGAVGPSEGRFSVGFNGLHGGSWLPTPKTPIFRPYPAIQPWRDPAEGSKIYVYGQMNDDRALRGLDMARWLEEQRERLQKCWPDRQIVIRKHPKMYSSWESKPPPLEETFPDTYLSFSWTSTAGVDAVLAGVQHTALHPGSLVYGHWIDGDNRWPLASRLAHSNWSLTEDLKPLRDLLIAGYDEARSRAAAGDYDDPGPMPRRYGGVA
jgi:hypothetical protein